MKKLSIFIVLSLLTLTIASVSFATNDITVLVNGEKVEFDRQPYIKDGRTMVPIRFIAEEIGCDVEWESKTKRVFIRRGHTFIILTIGKTEVYLDEEFVQLDVAPEINIDRTMVPLRFISETMGYTVKWDHTTRTVSIETIQSDFIEPEIKVVYPNHEFDGFEFQVRLENWNNYHGYNYEVKIEFTNYPINTADVPAFGPDGFGSAWSKVIFDSWKTPGQTLGEIYSLRKYYTTKDKFFELEKDMIFKFTISIRNNDTGEQRNYEGTAIYKDLLKDLRR
ncbi:UNVERIFIED_CONTAM: copper amine oxidase-like protein [Acetivibrio alkalicellulosi]